MAGDRSQKTLTLDVDGTLYGRIKALATAAGLDVETVAEGLVVNGLVLLALDQRRQESQPTRTR